MIFDNVELRRIALIANAIANPLRAVLIVINYVVNGEYFNKYSAITNITIKDAFSELVTGRFFI